MRRTQQSGNVVVHVFEGKVQKPPTRNLCQYYWWSNLRHIANTISSTNTVTNDNLALRFVAPYVLHSPRHFCDAGHLGTCFINNDILELDNVRVLHSLEELDFPNGGRGEVYSSITLCKEV